MPMLPTHTLPFTPLPVMPGTYGGLGSIGNLGSAQSQQINAIVTTGAASTISLLAAFGAITGPVGAVVGGLIALGSTIASFFQGCGQTCIITAQDANKAEPLLQQNLQLYLQSPVRTRSMQAAALNNFDTVWSALRQACSDPSLGSAGQRCISDRQSGSCAYHTTPGGWQHNADGTCTYTYPGSNNSGSQCWNWFIGYRDPIANDPCVLDDSAVLSTGAGSSPATAAAGALSSALSGSSGTLLLLAALAAGVMLLGD